MTTPSTKATFGTASVARNCPPRVEIMPPEQRSRLSQNVQRAIPSGIAVFLPELRQGSPEQEPTNSFGIFGSIGGWQTTPVLVTTLARAWLPTSLPRERVVRSLCRRHVRVRRGSGKRQQHGGADIP